ncbi:MAG: ion transporter [Bacteroidales bacterium]
MNTYQLSKFESKSSSILKSRIYRTSLKIVVFSSVALMLLSTFRVLSHLNVYLYTFSFLAGLVFTVDYTLRIVTAPSERKIMNAKKARLKYLFSFYGIVDFAAILPFLAPIFTTGTMTLDLIELGRLLLIFKIARYSNSFKMVIDVFNDVKWELLFSIFIMSCVIFICAVLMYYVERDAQPDNFRNIGDGLWWAIITYTTVGYGDIYPITILGRALSAFTALIGIAMVAFPTGIISSAFMRRMNEIKKSKTNETLDDIKEYTYCPHCGEKLKE